MHDLSRSQFTEVIERAVTTGSTVSEEGCCLVAYQTGNVETVKPSAGTTGEVFVGFSQGDVPTKAYESTVSQQTVPADSPYTVQLHTNIVATQIQIYNYTDSSWMTETAGAPAATQYAVNDTTGVATFNSAQAGDVVLVYYRYALTVVEARQKYFQNHVNGDACQEADKIGVIRGSGEIWTDQWDAAIQWALSSACVTGASGRVTVGGNGSSVGRVISIPTVADPYLGIAFDLA